MAVPVLFGLVSSWELAIENQTSPMVLAFVLGAVAVVLRSDLRLPDPIHTWLSSYLLLAIGLKGGRALVDTQWTDVAVPALTTVAAGAAVAFMAFAVATRILKLRIADAGSLAAHYGSVSVVTFTAAMLRASESSLPTDGVMTSLVALLEVPGIIVALLLVSRKQGGIAFGEGLREVLTGRSVLLLLGGLVIGRVASDTSFAQVEPFFVTMFAGLLTLFLLDMGATVARRIRENGWPPLRIAVFGIVAPVVFGAAGVLIGTGIGLETGGAAVFGVMLASASYIAAPAAMRTALPDANNEMALVAALGVTFPFNLTVNIPLLFALAKAVG
ncbi:MAG: sodium-dependent bicarbonate transport family permease [Ilumatobacteraceae bacterium]